MLDPHGALIYTMVIVSASDSDMTDAELAIIGDIVGHLPAFRGFDRELLPDVLEACTRLLNREDGLDEAFTAIKKALPANLAVGSDGWVYSRVSSRRLAFVAVIAVVAAT